MERCLDCNTLMTKDEKVCIECGTKVGGDESKGANMMASVTSIVFYISMAATVVSLLVDTGLNFTLCLMVTSALMIISRSAKDGATKVTKR